jgi:hypothetical protein
MLLSESFFYSDLNQLIEINTLSPGKNFYYKVQKPLSINMSNFACRISFYDANGALIYYRHNTLAHWLEPWQKIELVKWSKQGNLAYFYEYQRNKVYESVFLNLKEKYCYRIDEMKNNFDIVHSLNLKDREFDEDEIISKLAGLDLPRHVLIKDKIMETNFLDNFLNRNRWYPSIR